MKHMSYQKFLFYKWVQSITDAKFSIFIVLLCTPFFFFKTYLPVYAGLSIALFYAFVTLKYKHRDWFYYHIVWFRIGWTNVYSKFNDNPIITKEDMGILNPLVARIKNGDKKLTVLCYYMDGKPFVEFKHDHESFIPFNYVSSDEIAEEIILFIKNWKGA